MKIVHRRTTMVLLVAACLLGPGVGAGVFQPESYPSWEETGVSQKLNLFTFHEDHEGPNVFVGTEVMRYHDDYTFFPLQIAVGNSNPIPVRLTPEEFVLTDDRGVYYPLAEQSAIQKEYNKSAFDQNLLATSQFLGNKFVAFNQIPSLFYPNITFGGVRHDRIELPEGTYLSDVLYFRKPEGTLHGHRFTLTVYFPQQEKQLDVKFELPGKAKGK